MNQIFLRKVGNLTCYSRAISDQTSRWRLLQVSQNTTLNRNEVKRVLVTSKNKDEVKSWEVDFRNVEETYRSKTTKEILRASLVFNLCAVNYLVENGMKISTLVEKLFGKKIFEKVMMMSFYGHFVAGKNHEEIKNTTSILQKHGVGAILDYAVEEDLSEEKAKDLEMDACRPNTLDNPKFPDEIRYKPHREFGDRRRKVVSARTYFYENEAKCDENMTIFLKCIEAAGASTDGGFAAVKLTALGRPQFLLQFSEVLVKGRHLFKTFSGKEGSLIEKKFDLERFEDKAERLGMLMSHDDSKKWFTWMDKDTTGFVDLLDWNELIANNRRFSDIFVTYNEESGKQERMLPEFSDEEEAQMKRMLQRVDTLAKKALECNVRLMIDAEQTYFQPAISRITVEMMRKYNKDRTVIMNTYQCYLKETEDNLLADLALAQREGFHFGLKLVRGAYMEHERERAEQLNYDDPVQVTYGDTTKNYHKLLEILLNEIEVNRKSTIMVASHNENTVAFALKIIHDLNMDKETESQVYFGQLLGMCDHITFPLGQAGHHVFKYVPYGPIREVLPYLYRRAQENKSVLSGAKLERQLLRKELWRRIRIFF